MAQFCQNCGLTLSSSLAPTQAAAPARAYAATPVVAYVAAPASPYGGFWIRLLAHLLDHVILSAVAAPLFFVMVLPTILRVAHEASRDQEPSPETIMTVLSSVFMYIILAFAGQWLYEALLTSSSWQGPIGKRVLRLKVVDEAGNRISFARASGRFFAKILSSMFFCVGYVMIAFTERKRGLHDLLAGTMVVRS